jgi:hypothetical protein
MKRTILLLITVLSLMPAYSCDYEDMSFLWWYFKSNMICSGTVIQVFESDSTSYDVKLLVDWVYKGDSLDTLRLTINSYSEGGPVISDCDVYMKTGKKYLVYARKSGANYFTGGQESRTNLESEIKIFHPNDFNWLDSINCKVTDFYWDWRERDIKPEPENFDSLVHNNFNIYTRDKSTVHGIWAFVLCNIDENGILTKSNLFYLPKGIKRETLRKIYEKDEYLNNEIECITEFQREALRVTKLVKKWTPSIFCGEKVKSQVLIKYEYDNGKLKIELKN